MAIDLDIDSITGVGDLSSAIGSSLSPQISSFTEEVSGGLGELVMGAGGNCDIFGGAMGMARHASESFRGAFKELTKNVQEAFATVATLAGTMIKAGSSTIGMVQQKLTEFSAWLATQAESVLDSAKSVLNSLKSVVNSSFSAVTSAMASCISFLPEIKNKMLEAVSAIPVRSCSPIAGAIGNIGFGAGIDSVVSLVTEPNSGKFSEIALSGLTGSLEGIYTSVNDLIGGIPDPSNTNSQLSSIMSDIDSLMGA